MQIFTARSRKIHPFYDNNNHVSAAQLWKYPENNNRKKKQGESSVIYYIWFKCKH